MAVPWLQKASWSISELYSCFSGRSSRWAHTFPLMKSMQKSRRNNRPAALPCSAEAPQRRGGRIPAIPSGQRAFLFKAPGSFQRFLLNIMYVCYQNLLLFFTAPDAPQIMEPGSGNKRPCESRFAALREPCICLT